MTFVASTLQVGGAERVFHSLMVGLAPERFATQMLLLREPGTLGNDLLASGVLGAARLQRHRMDLFVIFRLAKHLKSFKPHIVFFLDHHNAILLGGLASLVAGVPRRVVASHSTGRMEGKRSFTASDRMVVRMSDRVIALSASHAGYLTDVEGVHPKKISVIANGIDTERYAAADESNDLRETLGISSDDAVVTIVASLRPEKAHEAVLKATRELTEEKRRIKTLIVGEGPRRDALERLRRMMELQDAVTFLGERHDIPELLQLSDVLVLPSHPAVETLPLAVLEAMAAGVPVVASRVGSLPDVIEDRVNGRLIEPADAGELAAAIREILDNSEETARLVQGATDTLSERYTIGKMISGYEALFEELATPGTANANSSS